MEFNMKKYLALVIFSLTYGSTAFALHSAHSLHYVCVASVDVSSAGEKAPKPNRSLFLSTISVTELITGFMSLEEFSDFTIT